MSFFTDEDYILRNRAHKFRSDQWIELKESLTGSSINHHAFYILATARRQFREGQTRLEVAIPICWQPKGTSDIDATLDGVEMDYQEFYEAQLHERNALITHEAENDLRQLIADQFKAPFTLNVFKMRVIGTNTGVDIHPARAEFIADIHDTIEPYVTSLSAKTTTSKG